MKIFSKSRTGKKDNSLGLFHGEAAAANTEMAGCSFQSNSIIATGASVSTVALLSTITNLVLAVLLIKVPSLVEGKTPMKRTVVLIAVINAFTWIPIVFVFLFCKNINPLMLIGLWILGLVPATLLGPLRDNWLANLIPSEKMGRYLSWRSAIAGIIYLAIYNIMGFTLFRATGNVYQGYAIVLGIAFLASVMSTILYTNINAPPAVARTLTAPTITFLSFLKGARKEHLGTFILFISLFTFAVNLSGPLGACYMQSELKFNYMTITLIVSCEYVARVLSLNFWGKLVDKSGSLRVLGMVCHLIPFGPILWLFSGNVLYLCMAQLFSGTVWAAFDLCTQTFIYKSTQPEQRLHYIVYYRSLTTFAAALGTLTSAVLLSNMFHIFGSQILGMMLLSGVMRMVVVRLMLPKLKPGGIPDAIVHEELARELAMVNYPTRQGLYYHPEAWSRFTKPVVAFGNILGKAVNKISPRTDGLYYHPQKWATYGGKNPTLQPGSSNNENSGLYHNKKAWAEYMQQTAVLVEADEESAKEGLLYNPEAWPAIINKTAHTDARAHESAGPARKGLLYDPEAWATMVNQMEQADAKFTESLKPARKGLLYDPEAWAKFVNQTTLAEAKAIDTAKRARAGIFYDSEKWSSYLKQSMVLNATTPRTGGDVPTNRQPLFYYPESWEKYRNQIASSRLLATKVHGWHVSARQPLLYHPEEWERTFDPAIVHIGRKSAIGTVINRPVQIKKNDRKTAPMNSHPVTRSAMSSNRIGVRPSVA